MNSLFAISRSDPYMHQAQWTRPMRRELYRRVALASRKAVLDVGCGHGLITGEMAAICKGRVSGVDSDEAMIEQARSLAGRAEFLQADVYRLPFPASSFDLVTAHWLFLWLKEPAVALQELRRVLTEEGSLLLAGEPDYGGRIVHPQEAELKEELIAAFQAQGADPMIGRKLPALLGDAGFSVTSGIYPGLWDSGIDKEKLAGEENWLRTALKDYVPQPRLDTAVSFLHAYHAEGKLLMLTPVFWAIGKKK